MLIVWITFKLTVYSDWLIFVATVLIIRQTKIKAEENFEMELISREEKIRDASREGTLV
jgi:hypothetical protein